MKKHGYELWQKAMIEYSQPCSVRRASPSRRSDNADNFTKAAGIGPDRRLLPRYMVVILGRLRIQSGIGHEKLLEDRSKYVREGGSLAGKGVEREFPDRTRKVRLVM